MQTKRLSPVLALPSVLAVLALVTATACDDGAGPGDSLTAAEASELSDAMVGADFAETSLAAPAGAAAAVDPAGTGSVAVSDAVASAMTGTMDFAASWSCPSGGQVVVDGTRSGTWDGSTGTGSMDLSLTKDHQACARPLQTTTITLDGGVTLAVHHAWESWTRSGLQTVSLNGQLDWATEDGRSGTCQIDIAGSYDPDTATRTVTGTFCDQSVSITRSWNG